jgi:hypothetical protein
LSASPKITHSDKTLFFFYMKNLWVEVEATAAAVVKATVEVEARMTFHAPFQLFCNSS